jgi:hypothetical protein
MTGARLRIHLVKGRFANADKVPGGLKIKIFLIQLSLETLQVALQNRVTVYKGSFRREVPPLL